MMTRVVIKYKIEMVMKNFQGKVAAISGAGSGIGQQLAILLAQQGCHLSLSDISLAGLQQTLALLKESTVKISTHMVDVAEREQVQYWAEQTVREHGQVNLIFNNAGVALASTVEGASYEDLTWITNINFWGSGLWHQRVFTLYQADSRGSYCQYFQYFWNSSSAYPVSL